MSAEGPPDAVPVPPDAVPVELNGQVQDPHEAYADDAEHTDFIVITVYEVLSVAQEDVLEELHVNILEDLGENNFLCEYCPSDLEPLRKLGFVRQVDVYRNKFKIPSSVEAAMQEAALPTAHMVSMSVFANTADALPAPAPAPARGELTVDIFTHTTVGEEQFEALKQTIAQASGVPVSEMEFAPGQVRLTVEPDKLTEIAKDPKIRIIEEVLQATLMFSESHATGVVARGAHGVNQTPYRGKDQIITVTDTGFDRGSRDDCHPAFKNKVLELRSIARKGDVNLSEEQKTNDPDGHGTHVSGILLGSHFNTTEGSIGGIAPDANLIVQSMFKNAARSFDLPMDVRDILEFPYDKKSRIFSNSWGIGTAQQGTQPEYADKAGIMDEYIRNHRDLLVCFSAGNDNLKANAGKPTIGVFAGAKNVLTVGATGNSASPDLMYDQSSRGPSAEGRLKPDVVAPGTDIYSALSRGVPRFFGKTATSEGLPDIKWTTKSGTSQATPLVAGCAAVLRQALQAQGCEHPPGALLKALIINGAEKLPGLGVEAQGHGRVNLEASLGAIVGHPAHSSETTADTPLSASGGCLIGDALIQDQEYEFVLSPPESTDSHSHSHSHFKITMAYNDIGKKQIQNNLNLFVTDAITKEITPGNSKSLTDPDQQNNVEQVILTTIPKGGLKVRVHAQKIFCGHVQDYVLAWSTFTPLPGVVF